MLVLVLVLVVVVVQQLRLTFDSSWHRRTICRAEKANVSARRCFSSTSWSSRVIRVSPVEGRDAELALLLADVALVSAIWLYRRERLSCSALDAPWSSSMADESRHRCRVSCSLERRLEAANIFK